MISRISTLSFEFYVLSFFLMSWPLQIISAQEKIWSGAEFSADRIEYDQSSPKKNTRSRVFVGSQGIREESTDHRPGELPYVVVIVNFKKQQTWMVAPGRRVYMPMPENTPGTGNKGDDRGGLFTNFPCSGFRKMKRHADQIFAGRTVEKWTCFEPGANISITQLYDFEYKIVVREERYTGRVEEFRNISLGKQDAKLFELPAGVRVASMKEFFTGTPEFARYKESGDEEKIPEKLLEQADPLPNYPGTDLKSVPEH